jgi:hypothetical protein
MLGPLLQPDALRALRPGQAQAQFEVSQERAGPENGPARASSVAPLTSRCAAKKQPSKRRHSQSLCHGVGRARVSDASYWQCRCLNVHVLSPAERTPKW